ncbi:MAG: hypothetical protein ABH851_08560, partial [Methanobacteriota archaeon]
VPAFTAVTVDQDGLSLMKSTREGQGSGFGINGVNLLFSSEVANSVNFQFTVPGEEFEAYNCSLRMKDDLTSLSVMRVGGRQHGIEAEFRSTGDLIHMNSYTDGYYSVTFDDESLREEIRKHEQMLRCLTREMEQRGCLDKVSMLLNRFAADPQTTFVFGDLADEEKPPRVSMKGPPDLTREDFLGSPIQYHPRVFDNAPGAFEALAKMGYRTASPKIVDAITRGTASGLIFMEPKVTDSEYVPMVMIDGKLELWTREKHKKLASSNDWYHIRVNRPGVSFTGLEGPSGDRKTMQILSCRPQDIEVGSINCGNPGVDMHEVSEVQGVPPESLHELVTPALGERYTDVNGVLVRVESENVPRLQTTFMRFRELAPQGVVYFRSGQETKLPPPID